MPLRTNRQWWGVMLDAPDARELARFYARLLDWELFEPASGDGASVAPSATAGFNLGFQTEPRYRRPVWPATEGEPQMSMHLEFEVDDLDEAVAHALSVGAELAAFQPQRTVRVLLDPAGHPFCLYLDEEAGTPNEEAGTPNEKAGTPDEKAGTPNEERRAR